MTKASSRANPGARGAVTVEYAVLVGFIVAVGLGAWALFGQRLACALGFAADQFGVDASGQGLCSKGAAAPGSGADTSGYGRRPAVSAP
jgi:Flp pilus assembly pilin Flp